MMIAFVYMYRYLTFYAQFYNPTVLVGDVINGRQGLRDNERTRRQLCPGHIWRSDGIFVRR